MIDGVSDTAGASRGHHVARTQRVIIVSSVGPAPTSAASLTLHRHLVERPGFEVSRVAVELTALSTSVLARTLTRLRTRSWLHRLVVDLETILYSWLPLHRRLPRPTEGPETPVVLTLAHGAGYHLARRYAAAHRLPLVVRFDDWWPDVARVHRPLRHHLRRSFRRLYRDAASAICISDAMRDRLGPHANACVIPPIARPGLRPATARPPFGPMRVCYLGNMSDYARPLLELVECIDPAEIRIEFRGHEPPWPDAVVARLRREARLHPFETGPRFEAWFESFHAYLVVMFFGAQHRRRVQTCFATKLVEYSSLGRPIVIWAPEDAAVVRWARRNAAALCVTDPDPSALEAALRALANDPPRQARLGTAARRAYESDFNPDALHEAFAAAIASAAVQVSPRLNRAPAAARR